MPKPTKREKFEALYRKSGWTGIHAAEWAVLRQEFSEGSLRDWCFEAGIPVDQPYRGVETKTLGALEDSLVAMAELYRRDEKIRKVCRTTVIAEKDRTRFASQNQKVDSAKRALKAEMLEWMLVWLDDPEMFRTWAMLRRRALSAGS